MTQKEWLAQADELDAKSREVYDRGDDVAGEMCERNADAARYCACYGRVDDE